MFRRPVGVEQRFNKIVVTGAPSAELVGARKRLLLGASASGNARLVHKLGVEEQIHVALGRQHAQIAERFVRAGERLVASASNCRFA